VASRKCAPVWRITIPRPVGRGHMKIISRSGQKSELYTRIFFLSCSFGYLDFCRGICIPICFSMFIMNFVIHVKKLDILCLCTT
jgi:hypothetical protein